MSWDGKNTKRFMGKRLNKRVTLFVNDKDRNAWDNIKTQLIQREHTTQVRTLPCTYSPELHSSNVA